MVESCSKTGGRRRRHTKKHKRHSRRRLRGGTTLPSISGVETFPGGHVDVRSGVNMSGENFKTPGYDGGRRRSRKTRRRRSMRGGSDGSRVTSGFSGEPIGGVAVGSAVYGAAHTGVQPA